MKQWSKMEEIETNWEVRVTLCKVVKESQLS